MWKWIFLVPFFLLAQELEVALNTRSCLKPVYLSCPSTEIRSILEFDLNASGHCIVLENQQENFDLALLKREKIPFCITANISKDQLEVAAFNVENETFKQYPPIPLKREVIHKLADAIQKDLFGKEGIASLRLIYTYRTKNQKDEGLDFLSEIWICDSDGANAQKITSENSYCLCPNFLPKSKDLFFYASEKTGQSKIYRSSLAHPKAQLLIDMRGNQALPAISRDGKMMAFISDTAGRPDLFIQHLDESGKMIGKAKQIFTAPRATQASPTFSPDGKKIAFVSDKDGPPRIYVLNIAHSVRPELITRKNRENTSPAWSQDGTKLAYSAKVDGVRQIWLYDFASGEETPLTVGNENKENPSWAPDNFHLVYNTENKDICELYLINLNQKEPIRIGKGRFASWQGF